MIKRIIIKFLLSIIIFTASPIASNTAASESLNNQNNPANISKKPTKNSIQQIALNKFNKAEKLEKKNKLSKAKKLYQDALEDFHNANKNDPFNPEILNYLGLIYQKLNRLTDAEIYYIIGLEISPKNFKINENLGKLYAMENKINLAKERLESLRDCNCEEFNRLEKKLIENKIN